MDTEHIWICEQPTARTFFDRFLVWTGVSGRTVYLEVPAFRYVWATMTNAYSSGLLAVRSVIRQTDPPPAIDKDGWSAPRSVSEDEFAALQAAVNAAIMLEAP